MKRKIAYALVIVGALAMFALSITSRALHPHFTETELAYRCWWVYPPFLLMVLGVWLVRNEQ